jgi:hypothetical protein
MPFRTFALRSLLARGVLALMLVFAQQHAALHWLAHAVDAVDSAASQKAKHGGPDDVCGECAGLIAFGAMAVGSPPVWALPAAERSVVETVPPLAVLRGPRLAFRSRAPPVLS